MRKAFEDRYLEKYRFPFYWDAANAANCKQLEVKIRYMLIEHNQPREDNHIINAMLSMMEVDHPFFQDNMSIKMLNSKFNEVLNKMRNGQKQTIDRDKLSDAIDRAAGSTSG